MARTLKELRLEAPKTLERLRAQMRFDLGTHKRTRLRSAGCGSSKTLLHSDVASSHGRMLADDYKRRLGKLTRAQAQERLRFLTVLHSVVPLDTKAVMRPVTQMESALARAFDGSGAWLLGAVEVEVVNLALLRRISSRVGDEARKLNVLEGLHDGDELNSGILVHFHGIVDLRSNWLLREEQLRKRFKKIKAWQRAPYQVELAGLHTTKAVTTNIRFIANYLTKGGNDQLRYNAGFGRELDDDLDAKIWRAGMGRADRGGDIVEDARGLTMVEVAFLDGIWRELMDRSSDERGYLVRISGRGT